MTFYVMIMLFSACNSFFSAAKSSRENFNPRILFQSNSRSLLLFSSEELLRGEWNKLSNVSAFCFMQFHVGRFKIPLG